MTQPRNMIGLIPSIAIVVGSVLGTGIFFAPSLVARFSTQPVIVIGMWVLGALLCVIGADIYGRLGEHIPCGGGQYEYLKKGIGPSTAAVYGWLSLFVLCPTMIAGMCLYLASHLNYLIPDASPLQIKGVACAVAGFLTLLNYRGIRAAGKFQSLFVGLQIFMILGMAAVLFFNNSESLQTDALSSTMQFGSGTVGTLSAGVLAFAAILWSFEGFNSLTFITDEIKNGKNKVRVFLFLGTAVVFILYVILNFCAIFFIGPEEISSTSNIAVRLNEIGFGSIGKNVTLVLTIVGLITTGHASVLISPRITQRLAEDSFIPKVFSHVHENYETPNNALSLQLVLVLAYVGVGSFESLITSFVVINWAFYMFVAISLLKILPKQEKSTLVYAEVLIFSSLILAFIATQFYQHPLWALIGLGFVGAAIYTTHNYLSGKKKTTTAFNKNQNLVPPPSID